MLLPFRRQAVGNILQALCNNILMQLGSFADDIISPPENQHPLYYCIAHEILESNLINIATEAPLNKRHASTKVNIFYLIQAHRHANTF